MKLKSFYLQQIKPLLSRPENRRGYLFYLKNKHEVLFNRLQRVGFFDFYTTNNGWIVSEHQIVAFFCCGGYKAMKNGFVAKKGEIEIHHINSVTTDNRPENLVYLSTSDHQAVSMLSHTAFLSDIKEVLCTPFNRQGKSITDHYHYIYSVVVETVLSVEPQAKIEQIVVFVSNTLPDLLQRQKKKVVRFFQKQLNNRVNFISV